MRVFDQRLYFSFIHWALLKYCDGPTPDGVLYCIHLEVLYIYTAVGPCVLPLARPVEAVEAQTEEGSSEEGV